MMQPHLRWFQAVHMHTHFVLHNHPHFFSFATEPPLSDQTSLKVMALNYSASLQIYGLNQIKVY